ncbi:hypothetical protein K461DRAFT_38591 [Myriangium duriaei CBS 260.36]|uniref:Uncharacterized protein n=1 Tax=Myriangium duriaei CBS 260.36 TaxID=1168546 RepID=A0A9P4MEJ7_9PEZI|nr:hypothetical protein K461DRAFT_38591 [Myriangium duriaei CBS 260.36]
MRWLDVKPSADTTWRPSASQANPFSHANSRFPSSQNADNRTPHSILISAGHSSVHGLIREGEGTRLYTPPPPPPPLPPQWHLPPPRAIRVKFKIAAFVKLHFSSLLS